MYTSLWKESAKDREEKKEWIWVVLSIFSEGFFHLVGLPVNPPLLPLWLIERMPLQVINGKWRLPKMESQPYVHLFLELFPPALCVAHKSQPHSHSNSISSALPVHFFWFKRLTLNTMLPSNRKMCVMHRPLICQCGRWWWAQLPGLLYSCPYHLPKKYFPSSTHTLDSEYF